MCRAGASHAQLHGARHAVRTLPDGLLPDLQHGQQHSHRSPGNPAAAGVGAARVLLRWQCAPRGPYNSCMLCRWRLPGKSGKAVLRCDINMVRRGMSPGLQPATACHADRHLTENADCCIRGQQALLGVLLCRVHCLPMGRRCSAERWHDGKVWVAWRLGCVGAHGGPADARSACRARAAALWRVLHQGAALERHAGRVRAAGRGAEPDCVQRLRAAEPVGGHPRGRPVAGGRPAVPGRVPVRQACVGWLPGDPGVHALLIMSGKTCPCTLGHANSRSLFWYRAFLLEEVRRLGAECPEVAHLHAACPC